MDATISGALIHTDNPKELRDWYANAFGAAPDQQRPTGENGFAIQLGEQYLLFFTHDEVSGRTKEPARIIINFDVADARAVAARLDGLGAKWIRPLEDGGPGRIGTAADPDGNYVQLFQAIEGAHE